MKKQISISIFLCLCLLFNLEIQAQSNLCIGFRELRDFSFGSTQYQTKKSLLSVSDPFLQDTDRLDKSFTDFYMALAEFNVPEEEYLDSKHEASRNDSVFISQSFFKLPKGCVSSFKNKVNLVFADDTLYCIDVEVEFAPQDVTYAMQLFNDLNELLAQKYPFNVKYDLKAYESEEIGGEGIEYYKFKEDMGSRRPNREIASLQMRNIFEYDFDSVGDYVSTGIISHYTISFSIVNYRFTRLNGLGEYR